MKEIYNKIYKALKRFIYSPLATNLKTNSTQENYSNTEFLKLKQERQAAADFWNREPPPSKQDCFKKPNRF